MDVVRRSTKSLGTELSSVFNVVDADAY